jgi:hypothetical protein
MLAKQRCQTLVGHSTDHFLKSVSRPVKIETALMMSPKGELGEQTAPRSSDKAKVDGMRVLRPLRLGEQIAPRR